LDVEGGDKWHPRGAFKFSGRLVAALDGYAHKESGAADIAVLLRQELRRSDERRRQDGVGSGAYFVNTFVDVPVSEVFPAAFDWESYGLVSQPRSGDVVRVTSLPWRPEWLQDIPDEGVDGQVARALKQRGDGAVPGDPFLAQVDNSLTSYKTPGQRSSVRSAVILPAGGTLVVNLPTGAGKTLAMLAAAETSATGSLSVIVVPTVALALDQERRYRENHPDHPATAYHGGLGTEEKKEFRRRIGTGEQRMIFTNPEALVSSLSWHLVKAAEDGELAVLAIDEAHVVGSWGDAFRPHFHAVAGLRNHLLRKAEEKGHRPLKTILATATLSGTTLDLLQKLFGQPGPFFHVAAPVVRPEPEYWQAINLEADERTDRLIEALRHLPRPAIVYTTLRNSDHAGPNQLTPSKIADLLRQAGFKRLKTVDGGTSTTERERVIRGLRNESDSPAEIDVVIGTSAFGLGIDIPDIRTVIHACLPENLDRFYQEVGRGGRDGCASISLVLSTEADVRKASALAVPTFLTADSIRTRWGLMLDVRQPLADDLQRLPLSTVREGLPGNTDYNELWNLQTISLLARAGALEWDFSFPAEDPDAGNPADLGSWVTVRVLRGDHMTEHFWSEEIEPLRVTLLSNARKGFTDLRETLKGNNCVGIEIAKSYCITEPASMATICAASCGGCLTCRREGRHRWGSPAPPTPAIKLGHKSDVLKGLVTAGELGQRVAIALSSKDFENRRLLKRLIDRLILTANVGLIVAPGEVITGPKTVLPKRDLSSVALMADDIDTFDPITTVGVPTLFLIPPGGDPWPALKGNPRIPLSIVCAYEDTIVPGRSLRLADLDGVCRVSAVQ
jgi:superfamily II DNA/RNA helicase